MRKIAVTMLVLGTLLGACAAPTAITGSWKRSGYQGIRPHKVAVLSLSKDKVHQAVIGASVAQALQAKGLSAETGLDILPDEDFTGKEQSSAKRKELDAVLSDKGYDLVVTAIFLDVTKDKHYVPGTMEPMPVAYYGSLGTYWTTVGAVYEPGYWVTSSRVAMETNVYELPGGKLIWTGQSETTDPSSLQTFADSYAPKLVARLFQEGVIK